MEVVANNQGLNLLRIGKSQVSEQIKRLVNRYENLSFAACGKTMERWQGEGEQVTIVPEAIIVRSGVVFIARRQQQGWNYIKV